MSQIPSRYAASGILIVWSAILFYFWASDRIASYLHPSFHIPVIATAIVLGILAIILVFAPAPESYGCDSRRKGPFAGGPVALAILVIPVLAAVKTSQSSFGATAVLNRGIIQDIGSLAGYQPPMDLMYAASDETMRSDFDGHQVEVVGQILPARTDNPSGDRFHLVRMFIMCCAADARPAGINIEKTGGTEFPEMSWVKVRGRATFPVENGRHSALVVAESIEETEPPRESFIY
jgi:uncharacterized repeat protein (TIGR03943 family)